MTPGAEQGAEQGESENAKIVWAKTLASSRDRVGLKLYATLGGRDTGRLIGEFSDCATSIGCYMQAQGDGTSSQRDKSLAFKHDTIS